MAFDIGSPVNITGEGSSALHLVDSSNNFTWTTQTTPSNTLQTGTPSFSSVTELFPTGEVDANTFRLRGTTNKVSLSVDPSVTPSYNIIYPNTAPQIGDNLIQDTSGNRWSNITPENTKVVRQDPGPGQYSSISAAISSISGTPSDTNRWLINVFPGEYVETPFVIPDFVYVVGESENAVTISPSTTGNFITFQNVGGLANATVKNVGVSDASVLITNSGNNITLNNFNLNGCPNGISCQINSSSTQSSTVIVNNAKITGSTNYALQIISDGITSNTLTVLFSNSSSSTSSLTSTTGIVIQGDTSKLILENSSLAGSGLGTALSITQGGRITSSASILYSWNMGMNVPADVLSPVLIVSSMIYDQCTFDLSIENANATGNVSGNQTYAKSFVIETSTLYVVNKNLNTITVGAKGCDFQLVGDAITYINTYLSPSSTNLYTIYVTAGEYTENNPLTLPAFTSIKSIDGVQATLIASDINSPLIVGTGSTNVETISLRSSALGTGSLIKFTGSPDGNVFSISGVIFQEANIILDLDSNTCVGATSSVCTLYSPIIHNNYRFNTAFRLRTTDGIHPTLFLNDGLIWNPKNWITTNPPTIGDFASTGTASTYVLFRNCSMGQTIYGSFGTGITTTGPGFLGLNSVIFQGFQNGLICGGSSSYNVIGSSVLFGNGVVDVSITNPNAFGNIQGIIALSKISSASNMVSFVFSDPNGSFGCSGDIYQGQNIGQITNISQSIQQGANLGVISGGIMTNPSGLSIQVSAGTGYLMVGSSPNDYLKYVSWGLQNITIPASILSWIYIDNTGTLLQTPAKPNAYNTIMIGSVKSNASGVEWMQFIQQDATHLATDIDDVTVRKTFGAIFVGGSTCISTPNSTNYSIDITGGTFSFSNTTYSPIAKTDIPSSTNPAIAYTQGSSVGTLLTSGFPLEWDNSGTLTALAGGATPEYTKHVIYLVMYGSTQKYILIYGQTVYSGTTAIADALAGPSPNKPAFFADSAIVPIAGVVVGGADVAPFPSGRLVNVCPALGFVAGSSTSTNNHSLLTNLGADDHLQYLRTDGTRVLTGNFMMGGNTVQQLAVSTDNIVGASGATNSLNVFSHASRHASNGSDPLPAGSISNAQLANSSITLNNGGGVIISGSPVSLGGSVTLQRDNTNNIVINPTTLSGNNVVCIFSAGATTPLTLPNTNLGQIITFRGDPLVGSVIINAPAGGSILNLNGVNVSSITITANTCTELSYQGSNNWIQLGGPITEVTTNTLSNKTLVAPTISTITNSGTLTLPTSTDVLVGRNTTDTLTNKTLTSPVISSIVNSAATLTLPVSTDTLVGRNTTDTLTNKTLTLPVISSISNVGTLTLPTSTDTLVGRNTTDTLTNKTLTSPVITNGGTLALPTGPETLVGRNTVDTLSNKTLTLPVISQISNTGTLSLPVSTDTLVGRNTTDTLTNKTLTLPIISQITNTGTLTLPTSTDTLVGRNTTDTLTNKSLISPVISTITNTGTLTLPTSTDVLVGRNTTDTLTNKTLTSPVITNGGILTLPTGPETLVGRSTVDTLANKTLTLPVISQISNTGTLTLPVSTDTLVGRNTTDTLTNKTLTLPVISQISNIGTLTLPTSTDTLVGQNTTDTLTNKTLTSPVISTITNTGTLTLPVSTDTLVGRNTTDTLTNKTLTLPVISQISNTGTLTLPTSTDTLVARNTTDTLTNKNLQSTTGLQFGTNNLTMSAYSDTVINTTVSGPWSTAKSIQFRLTKIGQIAFFSVPQVSAASSTAAIITFAGTFPTGYIPSAWQVLSMTVIDNDTNITNGAVQITNTGAVTIGKGTPNGTFSSTGNVGWYTFTVPYVLV